MTSNIQLYQGDCLEVMKNIPDKIVDLVLTDPPYRMTKRGKSCRPNWMPDNMGSNVFDGDIPDFKEWLKLCYDKLNNKTHLYIFTNTVSLQDILNSATNVGFKLHNVLTMIKDTGMPNRWYYKQTELVLFLRKGEAKPINDYTSRDWFNATMPKAKDGKLHITQKPLDVIEKLLTNSSFESQTILDPFMGSGTTGIACLNTARNFIGIEKDEGYFKIAKDRIETAKQKLYGAQSCS